MRAAWLPFVALLLVGCATPTPSEPETTHLVLVDDSFVLQADVDRPEEGFDAFMGGHCAGARYQESPPLLTLRLFGDAPADVPGALVLRRFTGQGPYVTVSVDRTEHHSLADGRGSVELVAPFDPRPALANIAVEPDGVTVGGQAVPGTLRLERHYVTESRGRTGDVTETLAIRDAGRVPVVVERLEACA